LIDDTEELVNLIKFRLIEKGYEVCTAFDGEQGLKVLKRCTPDLIVLDVNMPKIGGLEFYKRISTEYGRSKIPVLFLTERSELENLVEDIEADGFLSKPFEIDTLTKEVDRILSGGINPRVYLFDNEENPNVKAIKEKLQTQRYDVVMRNGLEQLQNDASDRAPLCILLEYMQKDMSGEELIRKIKQIEKFKSVPVLVYSYSGFQAYEAKSLNAGATKYLGKPESLNIFVSAVRALELGDKRNWSNP
jgi:DNA-binding response OmpR family regulator